MNYLNLKNIYNFLKNKSVILIIFFSFLFSLSYSFYYKIPPVVDARAYDNIGLNLVNGYGFKEDKTQSYEFDLSIVRAGPGYEFFLAGIYKIFGHHYEMVWFFQAILHAVSAWLLYLIARLVFQEKGEKIGLIAAAVFGGHPDLIEISAMLMTETLYLFLMILALWMFVLVYKRENKIYSLGLGGVLALSVLTRPPVLLFVPAIIFFYLYQKKFVQLGLFCSACLLFFLPWIIRNYLIYHQLVLTTMIGEYNLWVGNTMLSTGGQISGGVNYLEEYVKVHGFFSLKQQASHEFLFFIFQHPLVFIKLCLLRFVRYFSLIRPMGFWFYQTGPKQLIFVASSLSAIVILFIGGFSGLVLSLRQKLPLLNFLSFFALTAPVLLLATVVQSRYRFQIYPFLSIYFGYFWVSFRQDARLNKKILLGVSVFLLVVSLIDVLNYLSLIQQRIISLL